MCLGALADNRQSLLFEYSPAALAQQLDLSSLCLPRRKAAYAVEPVVKAPLRASMLRQNS